jgi:hypothetical protein
MNHSRSLTFFEWADTNLVYNEVGGNSHAAARHTEKFPNWQQPNYNLFIIYQRLKYSGCFVSSTAS